MKKPYLLDDIFVYFSLSVVSVGFISESSWQNSI